MAGRRTPCGERRPAIVVSSAAKASGIGNIAAVDEKKYQQRLASVGSPLLPLPPGNSFVTRSAGQETDR
jgi:hypothetical protein